MTTTPHVGPAGEEDRDGTDPEPWTDDELAMAERDVLEWVQLQITAAARIARHGQHGATPGRRTRSYYAARAHVWQSMIHPPRIVTLPDDLQPLKLDRNAMWTIPNDPDEPDPRLCVQYRCPECSCGVSRDHVPGSADCEESRRLRHESITEDG